MYKSRGKQGLFDEEFTKKRLSIMGNPLDSILKVIDLVPIDDGEISKQGNGNGQFITPNGDNN